MQQRPDIKVIVEPQFNPSFVKLTSYSNSSSTGYFLFTVANRPGTSAITLTAKAFNYQDALLGSKTQNQPFAVVNYAPYFKSTSRTWTTTRRTRAPTRGPSSRSSGTTGTTPAIRTEGMPTPRPITERERHPREGPDQLVQLHGDRLGSQRKPHFGRHQPGPVILERDRHRPRHEDDEHDLSRPHLLPEDREVLLHVETCPRSRATPAKVWSTSTSPSWPSRRGSPEATTGSSTRRTSTSLSTTADTSRSSPTGPRASTLRTRSTSLS